MVAASAIAVDEVTKLADRSPGLTVAPGDALAREALLGLVYQCYARLFAVIDGIEDAPGTAHWPPHRVIPSDDPDLLMETFIELWDPPEVS